MSGTRLGLTTKATSRERKKILGVFSGHRYPNVRVVIQPKMASQALHIVSNGLGQQNADSQRLAPQNAEGSRGHLGKR